jgi:exonuclease III
MKGTTSQENNNRESITEEKEKNKNTYTSIHDKELESEDPREEQSSKGRKDHTYTYHKYQDPQEQPWTIATMNVRGLKDGIKPIQLADHMESQNIQMLGIAETNFMEEDHKFITMAHSKYRSYWANGERRGEGVGIMLDREIDKHTVKVKRYEGRIITLELLFKDRVRLGIAQIYLPSDKTKRMEWERKLRQITQGWENNNTHTIVMGDFNAVVDPRKDRKGGTSSRTESTIFRDMRECNLQDNFRIYNEEQKLYTWEERNLGSRIDMIWTSEGITEATQYTSVIDYRDEMNTDHKQPTIRVDSSRFKRVRSRIREHKNTGPYDLKKLEEKDWKDWGEDLDKHITDSHTPKVILEEKWRAMEEAMRVTADKHFTRIRIRKGDERGRMNHKPTPLYTQYKKLNRLMALTLRYQEKQPEASEKPNPYTDKLKKTWEGIDQTLVRIPDPSRQDNLETWKRWAKSLRSSIRNTIRIEQRHIDRTKIQERIEQRILKFRDKKKEVIKNITGRGVAPIKMRNIIREEDQEISTDSKEILKGAARYFQENRRERIFGRGNTRIPTRWLNRYIQTPNVNQHTYTTLSEKITREETEEAIKEGSNSKAPDIRESTYG